MKISKLEHSYTIMNRSGFMVVKYKAKSPVRFPDGSENKEITAVGVNLPELKGVLYELSGEFEDYEDKKTGKKKISFNSIRNHTFFKRMPGNIMFKKILNTKQMMKLLWIIAVFIYIFCS